MYKIFLIWTLLHVTLCEQLPKGCREVIVKLEEECHVEMVDECDDANDDEEKEECSPMTRRECQIVMREVWTPMIVTKCKNSVEDEDQCGVRSVKCMNIGCDSMSKLGKQSIGSFS